MQLEFNWTAAEVENHAIERGIRGISLGIVLAALQHGDLKWIDDQQCSVLRKSQRGLAALTNGSKSGVQKALTLLTQRGVVSVANGIIAIWWDALRELPTALEQLQLPPPMAANGHRAVSSCIQEQEQIPTNTHNTAQDQIQIQSKSALGYTLTWADLSQAGQLNRPGITKFFRAAASNGWIENDLDSYAELIALVALVCDHDRRKAAGIRCPLPWLVGVVRAGKRSWVWRLSGEEVERVKDRLGGNMQPAESMAETAKLKA